MSDQGHVSNTAKELLKLKTRQPSFKIDKRLEKILYKEDKHTVNKHLKRKSLPIKEKQIKTRMRYHNTLIKMAKMKTTIPSAGVDVRDWDACPSLVEMPDGSGKWFGNFL